MLESKWIKCVKSDCHCLYLFCQVFLFASELFSVVNFLDDSEEAFNYLFLLNPNDSDYAIYTKNQFYLQVHHSLKQVSNESRSHSALDTPGGGGGTPWNSR